MSDFISEQIVSASNTTLTTLTLSLTRDNTREALRMLI